MMRLLHEILNPLPLKALAYTFLHSWWIGAVAAILLFILLQFLHKKSPAIKYNLAIFFLSIFLAGNVAVFIHYYQPEVTVPATNHVITSTTQVSTAVIKDQPAIEENLFSGIISLYEEVYPALVAIWLSGILLLSLRFTGGIIYSNRIRRRYSVAPDQEIIELSRQLAVRMNINSRVKVFKSTMTDVPAVTGFFKPVILLPASILMQIPYNQLEAVLAHEMAHIRRNDHLVNLIQTLVEVIFFYHPAVYWISNVIRKEREEVCDDIALSVCTDKLTYAKALMNLEEYRLQSLTPAVAFTGRKTTLINRLKRIMMKNERKNSYASGIIASILVISALAFLSVKAENLVNQTTSAVLKPSAEVPEILSKENISYYTPDTIHVSSEGKSQTLVISTTKDGKQVVLQKENGEISRLEVDGKTIEPENYNDYEEFINEVQEDFQFNQEVKLAQIEERMAEREKIRSRMAEEREEMHLQRQRMMDSLREEHRQRSEMIRQRIIEQNEVSAEKMKEQIEKQIEYLNRIKDDTNLLQNYHRIYGPGIPDVPQIYVPSPDEESLELIELMEIPGFDAEVYPPEVPDRSIIVELERNRDEIDELREIHRSPGNVQKAYVFSYNNNNDDWNEQVNRQRILNELYEDQLLKPHQKAEVYLTDRELIVNGEKQPRKIMKKYRDMYEALSGEEIGKDEIIEIQ